MEKAPENLALILEYFSDFTSTQMQQFSALEDLYKEWNARINVISRKDIDGIMEKHILHSLSIAAVASFKKGAKIIDIGTGGGFPGIPLAVFFPDLEFLLVDSIGKKLKVVDAIAREIGLKNVSVLHTRAEDIRDRKFDYVVSRAVAPLEDLWRWGKPLLAAGRFKGRANPSLRLDAEPLPPGLICLKGGDLTGEITASKTTPLMTPVDQIFPLTVFKEKYLLYVPA